MTRSLLRPLVSLLLLAVLGSTLPAQAPARNVVLVTLDGLRWQELFGGADSALLADTTFTRDQSAGERFWAATPELRRRLMMPFLWDVVATRGQVFGDPSAGDRMRVLNGRKFSYPGYNEMLVGFPDDRIDSNDRVPNPNVTVLEWLNRQPGFRGRVAAFSTWDVFNWIVNEDRSGVLVNAGWEPLPLGGAGTERRVLLNQVMEHIHREWDSERWDALTWFAAREHLVTEAPRVLYLALGETDDWAHEGRYDRYLDAAWEGDRFLRELWTLVQSLPAYRDRTALIITTDHGRGDGRRWTDHGRDVVNAELIWAAVMGPGLPALGVRAGLGGTTQGQIAATVASVLGLDYNGFAPRAAEPLPVRP